MRILKTIMLAALTASFIFLGVGDIFARGGGFHGGGGFRGGGGFHGGHEDFDRGGSRGDWGERGGGEGRRDDWGNRGDRGDHGQGNHGKHNNNNGNTTNIYNVSGNGGWGWGAADGALAGMAVGAVVGAAAASSSPDVIVEQPTTMVVQQTQPQAAQVQTVPGAPAYGTIVTMLPSGSIERDVKGVKAYQNGQVWYRPFFGQNGVYYEVVSPPTPDMLNQQGGQGDQDQSPDQ